MEDVWQFRYYETTQKGQRCRRSRIIGTLKQFPTRADALCILERFRLRLNLQHRFSRPVSLDALIDHYVERELSQLRYGTQQAHRSTLNRWIRPRWGACQLDEIPKDDQCPQCHAVLWFVEPLGNFAGQLILSRSWSELKNGDWTLAIVLSAMAVECEMARLYLKWNEIDLMTTRTPADTDQQAWEDQWRKFYAIGVKLDKVSELLTGGPFDSFLAQNTDLLLAVQTQCPEYKNSISQKKFFEDEFFKRRNRIVHRGEIDFQQTDAELCFTIATSLWRILDTMDAQRLRALNAEYSAHSMKGPSL
jgi:hypothetical protein